MNTYDEKNASVDCCNSEDIGDDSNRRIIISRFTRLNTVAESPLCLDSYPGPTTIIIIGFGIIGQRRRLAKLVREINDAG